MLPARDWLHNSYSRYCDITCLASYAVVLASDIRFKKRRDVRLWYFERCWRYERPQEGRYREFFQFGLEVVNPAGEEVREELIEIAQTMVAQRTSSFEVSRSVKRGLAYYVADGFEIAVPELGAQKQVVGGGAYPQGIGFAVGFDRLMLCGRPADSMRPSDPGGQ